MHEAYDDYKTGTFVPHIEVHKREDNGHYTASSMGYTVTHHSSEEAVNRLTETLRDEITKGVIHPGM